MWPYRTAIDMGTPGKLADLLILNLDTDKMPAKVAPSPFIMCS
jgi:hypothetical protein